MVAVRKQAIALFVDRSTQQWIVRDPDGNYWALPGGDDGWEKRQGFEPTSTTDLEPVPGHYKYLLNFPFEQPELHHDRRARPPGGSTDAG